MNALVGILKKPFFVIALGFIVTAVIIGLLGVNFILPEFSALSINQQQTARLLAKDQKLAANIAQLKNLDKSDLTTYQKTLDSFFPENNDYLHFATLNEALAKQFGLTINSLTLAVASPVSATPTAGANASGSVGGGSAIAPTTSLPSTTSSGYYVLVSYKGVWSQILNLLTSLKSLDRATVGSKALFSVPDTSGQIAVSVTYFLPLSASSTVSASSDSFVSLSEKDKTFLTTLQSEISYRAKPATDPVGKNNPFVK